MMRKQRLQHGAWWRFIEQNVTGPAPGTFRAAGADLVSRLYFPLANEAGMLSWTSPRLHGSPAVSHHQYLSVPLTAEDLPHTLIHRDFWITEPGRPPFALSGLSPEGLLAHLDGPHPARNLSWIEAGPGWFSLARRDPQQRFLVCATLWCPADLDASLELMWVRVTNISSAPLACVPYAAIPLFARSADNVRDHRHVTVLLHRIRRVRYGVVVRPTMSFDERGHCLNATRYTVLGFGPSGQAPDGVWALEEQFLGEGGSFAAPAAVWNRQHAPARESVRRGGREGIGGFRFRGLRLRPGAAKDYLLVCGISDRPADARRWIRWAHTTEPKRSLERTKAYWLRQIHRVSFSTAERALDHWLTWVGFQPLLRRLYGNSHLPQFDYGRGGRGWRDLWQDCLALLLSDPSSVRPLLLHHFGGVRFDGSNATIIGRDGAFSADRNNIPRTWMDHGVWPTDTTLLYVHQTGDLGFLSAPRAYFRDPQIFRCRRQDPHWNASQGFELRTRRHRVYAGSVLEHMLIQNLTAFFNVGAHNLCRLEGADWNDGLDMAAQYGESVAFSAFYAWNLRRLAEIADELARRGRETIAVAEEVGALLDRLPGQIRVDYRSASAKRKRLDRYLHAVSRGVSGRTLPVRMEELSRDLRAKHDDLAHRIRTEEWMAAGRLGFFNGYYDNAGRRVEGPHPKGVRMMLTGQVFPLMAGIATDKQVDRIMISVRRLLADGPSGAIRLNTDFGAIQPNLGRAFSFAYGEKENGAVFSHMAVLYAYALYLRRRPEEARRVWAALYTASITRLAKMFPGLPEYFNADGRGMYCYLTGSASWLIHLLLTQAYGVRGELGDLVIDPQLTLADFNDRAAIGVSASFADRPLLIAISNPRRLPPGRYAILRVSEGDRAMPFARRAEGGIRLPRRLLERFPKNRQTHLHVRLGPLSH